MDVIRFAELEAQPWRNGGGITREIACLPIAASSAAQGASDPGWDWRVSIADVTHAGEFSPFPGMERLLTVIEGDLMVLDVNGLEHRLEKYKPFRFSGEAASNGSLPNGAIRDLNVITRIGSFESFVSITQLSEERAQLISDGQLGILLQGQAQAKAADQTGKSTAPLRYDTVMGLRGNSLAVSGEGKLATVSIHKTTPRQQA